MIQRVTRLDEGPSQAIRQDVGLTLSKPIKTREGFWRYDAKLTRSGVFRYIDGAGNVRLEYRPEAEVRKATALMNGLPFTVRHPEALLDSTTAKAALVGVVLTPKFDGKWVSAQIIVHTQEAVDEIKEHGLAQTSQGYTCDIEVTPGVSPSGEAYDVIQRNIIPNHQSAVATARAGSNCRLRLDGASYAQITEIEDKMFKYTLPNGRVIEFSTQVQLDAFTSQVHRADKADAKLDSQKNSTASADKVNALAQRKVTLIHQAGVIASAHGKSIENIMTLSERDLMVTAIKMDNDKFDPAGKGDGAIEGYFESAFDRAPATKAASAAPAAPAETKTDSVKGISNGVKDPRNKNKSKGKRVPAGTFKSNAERKALRKEAGH